MMLLILTTNAICGWRVTWACPQYVFEDTVSGCLEPFTGRLLDRFPAIILCHGGAIWGGVVLREEEEEEEEEEEGRKCLVH